ncbi:hypothetical protein RN001_006570 [Aquatica leii]|uniref:Uncharacterized protein n=1 Tax=Aquatica leii TaxID=1421715 RepID=A0AAN7PL96_9COLE|nr:hypothetical protein RN001_006570 [Aquatica leii]
MFLFCFLILILTCCNQSQNNSDVIHDFLLDRHDTGSLSIFIFLKHLGFICLINLSYKLPLQKWQARGAKNKEIIDIRKHETRQKFKSELGLIIDKPKPGYGSSNNGNTARRFFENAAVSSEITGIDIEVIKRFRTILRAMSSRYTIDLPRFQAYTLESAHLFVEKYSWYCMPPTIHKVLIHGPIIIETALLPIGQLSEEAQEANNKIVNNVKENKIEIFNRFTCHPIELNPNSPGSIIS